MLPALRSIHHEKDYSLQGQGGVYERCSSQPQLAQRQHAPQNTLNAENNPKTKKAIYLNLTVITRETGTIRQLSTDSNQRTANGVLTPRTCTCHRGSPGSASIGISGWGRGPSAVQCPGGGRCPGRRSRFCRTRGRRSLQGLRRRLPALAC